MEPKLLDNAFYLAGRYGQRAGLTAEDTEDCAVQFAERMLTASPPDFRVEPWLRRCARNHVVDCVRALRRRQAYVCPWPQVRDGDDSAELECADDEPGADAGLMRDEFWRHLMAAFAKLDPVPQQIFLRHYQNGDSVQAVAVAFHRTPHAVEQTLLRARKHLRAALERQGLTESELRQYLVVTPVLRWHSPDHQ